MTSTPKPDVKEAAGKFASTCSFSPVAQRNIAHGFTHGAAWQAEQDIHKIEMDDIPGYSCIVKIHHENDKEIYISQCHRIKEQEAKLAEMSALLVEHREMITTLLKIHGCGCEPITYGGWTCPAHELLAVPLPKGWDGG